MPGLGLAGLIAVAFGLGSYYVTGELGRFGEINLAAGALALLAAGAGTLRRVRGVGTPLARRLVATRALAVLGVLALGVGLERGLDVLGLRFDWTLDRRYTLAPATRETLEALPDSLRATLYYDREDPRIRGTRLLLETFAATGEVEVRERVLDDASEAVEEFGISSSNSVVLEVEGRWELVGRPTEGTLWEALQRLQRQQSRRVVYFSRGAGEGSLQARGERGYSGLAAALQNEGYRLRDLVLAAVEEVPADAAALLVISPDRPLRPPSLALLDGYLEGGGGLVALADPDVSGGLVELLERWGFGLPPGVVVDPASGPIEGGAPGVNPLAHAFYSDHPITAPFDANRMVFFVQARPVEIVRKPEPDDDLRTLVFSSPRAWLSRQVEAVSRGLAPDDRDGAPPDRFALMSVGSYPRGEAEARIAAFGDSDFASNAYLRSLYNLDLIVNAVHWVADRGADTTRRPNVLTVVQRPLTPQESLTMFYGAGLLLPELLLIAAGITWLRRRSA